MQMHSLALLALAGCATATVPDIPGCREGPCVAVGESQQVAPDFAVKPLNVREDSRCPIEADCIWAGRVMLEAELTLGHEVITVELASDDPYVINGGTLSIAEIAPDASVRWPQLTPGDYRFRFAFEPVN